jgi:spermidine synthase
MVLKGVTLDGMRSAAAAAKPFPTQYDTLDVHRAALVLPEFVRTALAPLAPKG